MEITEAQTVIDEGKGIYGHKYYDAMETLGRKHRDDPCPEELTKTKTLRHDGFECNVYYNYVPPYGFGVRPLNVWWGFAEIKNMHWSCPIGEGTETLEEACNCILPLFIKVVERYKQKIK